jgi:hypothetical protein
MKTVIVFDTEDREGMQNTLKIVDHLAKVYLHQRVSSTGERLFGKIKFIKAIRAYHTECAVKSDADPEFKAGLREAKHFTDTYWEQYDNQKIG